MKLNYKMKQKLLEQFETDFINLVKELDAYLKITDGDDHDFYNQYNNIDVLKHVVVVYIDKFLLVVEQLKNLMILLWK